MQIFHHSNSLNVFCESFCENMYLSPYRQISLKGCVYVCMFNLIYSKSEHGDLMLLLANWIQPKMSCNIWKFEKNIKSKGLQKMSSQMVKLFLQNGCQTSGHKAQNINVCRSLNADGRCTTFDFSKMTAIPYLVLVYLISCLWRSSNTRRVLPSTARRWR